MEKELQESFKNAVEPAIKWLNENVHPHHHILIDCSTAELLEGALNYKTEEFIRD